LEKSRRKPIVPRVAFIILANRDYDFSSIVLVTFERFQGSLARSLQAIHQSINESIINQMNLFYFYHSAS
jgi:hypothetical protein